MWFKEVQKRWPTSFYQQGWKVTLCVSAYYALSNTCISSNICKYFLVWWLYKTFQWDISPTFSYSLFIWELIFHSSFDSWKSEYFLIKLLKWSKNITTSVLYQLQISHDEISYKRITVSALCEHSFILGSSQKKPLSPFSVTHSSLSWLLTWNLKSCFLNKEVKLLVLHLKLLDTMSSLAYNLWGD